MKDQMPDPTRCEPTDHNYIPVPRERIRETVSKKTPAGHHVEYEYEPARIYCTKCGWVRRIDDIV